MTRRRRVVLALAASALAAGSLTWFVWGPLANVVCATAGPSLNEPTDTKLWACRRACVRDSARDCVYYDELHNGDIKEMQRLLNASDAAPSPPPRERADDAERAQSACENGDAGACGALGVLYAHGVAFDPMPDSGRARIAWARGCDGGDASSCTHLGELDFISGQPDYARALPLLRRGCEGGDGRGCLVLGNAYERGEGVPKDGDRSRELYDRSCALGWASGCADASDAFRRSGESDHALASALRGCLLDDALACDRLLQQASDPLPARVVEVTERECAADPTGSVCYRLGLRLMKGEGVDRDAARGRAMFLRACHAGTIPASGDAGTGACDSYADLVELPPDDLFRRMFGDGGM